MTVGNVVSPAPQPESASNRKSATRDVNFLRSDSRYRVIRERPFQRYTEIFGFGGEGQMFNNRNDENFLQIAVTSRDTQMQNDLRFRGEN